MDDDEVCRWAVTVQAYFAYMHDLRRGKHVGTLIEKVIWASLVDNLDIVETKDRFFAEYLKEEREKKFPTLFEEVFLDYHDELIP